MSSTGNIALVFSMAALAALGACSTTAPLSGTPQVDASGSYSITQDGVTRTIGPATAGVGGTSFQGTGSSTYYGVIYDTADVLAIAGVDVAGSHATFAGLNGTLSTTVPTTGTGTYNGRYLVNWWNYRLDDPDDSQGALTTTVDFNAGTLKGLSVGVVNDLTFSVSGTLQGAEFSGTADLTGPSGVSDFTGVGTNVPMTGGFYGAGNTVVGIVQNGDISGIFYGN